MNELYQRLPSALQSILCGNVPDVEWQLRLTPQLESSLARAIEQWEFVRHWFREACQDTRCRVPLMPTLFYCGLIVGRIPSLPMATQIIQSSPLADGDLSARVYQAYTGFLREMACGVEAVKLGWQVFKQPVLDLQAGTDWIFRREHKVQVSMPGRASASHWANRKVHKTADDVIVLTAEPSQGLATVSASAISAALSDSMMSA
jgi:hypothetical protein